MSSLGSVLIVVLAVVLLVVAVVLLRSRNPLPWPAIVVAWITSGVCFTVGGGSGQDEAGPSVATVAAAVVAFLGLGAATIALVPRSRTMPPSRVPIVLSSAGIVIGAVGLLVNLVTG